MRAKKIISMLLIGTAALCLLAGCGASKDKNRSGTAVENPKETENAADAKKPTGEGKALVVYYSATGNTKEAADTIAKAVNADTFELQPSEPYSDADLDWKDENSRVSKEHDDPDDREVDLVSVKPDNWETYETVFIGYPIWWGNAAWPLDGFVEANDFTGKTVIPFCTSSSSGMGESGEALEKTAGTGEWLEGKRFQSGASEKDVQLWIGELGMDK